MAAPRKQPTQREKAALFALVCGVIDTWKDAYIIGAQRPEIEISRFSSLNSIVTRWKTRPEIQELYKELQEFHDAQRLQMMREGEERSKREGEREREERREKVDNKPGKAAQIDYNDPKERRKAYNRIIAESQDDPKTQLDALKVIEGLQKDDRQAAKDAQIQRFYTPLKCQNCPLYTKAKKTTL